MFPSVIASDRRSRGNPDFSGSWIAASATPPRNDKTSTLAKLIKIE